MSDLITHIYTYIEIFNIKNEKVVINHTFLYYFIKKINFKFK